MVRVSVSEAAMQLVSLVESAALGETVIILNEDNQPLAQLTRVYRPTITPKFGIAAGEVWIADDFDAPLEDFAEYM